MKEITMKYSNGEVTEIVEQVKICPSGALSYIVNHESA